jgi:hypothetical protein
VIFQVEDGVAKRPWPYRARDRRPWEIEEHVVSEKRPVLYIVACGGRPAAQLERLVRFAQDDGWDACVILTPDAVKFADMAPLAELTGYPVRVQYKHPDEPDVLPPADAFVVAPATFNTFNKMAVGASDTLALGLLNEGIGARACPSSRCRGPTSTSPAILPSSAALRCCASGA